MKNIDTDELKAGHWDLKTLNKNNWGGVNEARLTLGLWRRMQEDLWEVKASLIYNNEFQDSQAYTMRLCL